MNLKTISKQIDRALAASERWANRGNLFRAIQELQRAERFRALVWRITGNGA